MMQLKKQKMQRNMLKRKANRLQIKLAKSKMMQLTKLKTQRNT